MSITRLAAAFASLTVGVTFIGLACGGTDSPGGGTGPGSGLGANDSGPGAGDDSSLPPTPTPKGDGGGSVVQHHNHATRDGLYVEPAFTKASVTTMHLDGTWPVSGPTYAAPLFL